MKVSSDNREEEKLDQAVYGNAHVQQYKTDVAFISLMQGVSRNRYVIPEFQRVFKWTQPQVEALAVSLIRGLPIPPIYTYRNDEGKLEILDGQQRVISMFLYYIGKYTKRVRNNFMNLKKNCKGNAPFEEQLEETYGLKNVQYKMKYYDIDSDDEGEDIDITYSKLPDKVKDKIDYTTITIVEINIDNPELKNKYLYKIFANLNAGGTQLTKQEIRNGIYRCDFYDMLFEFQGKNGNWRKFYQKENDDSRGMERLLRLCAFRYYVYVKDGKFVIDSYKNINSMLNDFSEKAVHFDEQTIEEYRRSLERFFSLFEDSYIPKEISFLENLFTVTDKKKIEIKLTKEICEHILKTKAYQDTIRQGNATKTVIETKLKEVYGELQKYVGASKSDYNG